MKVHRLIEILQQQDPDAQVLVMFQPKWPWELEISGVAVRKDLPGVAEGTLRVQPGTAPTDVFLVDGEQVRRGDSDAWKVAVR